MSKKMPEVIEKTIINGRITLIMDDGHQIVYGNDPPPPEIMDEIVDKMFLIMGYKVEVIKPIVI